MRVPLSKMLAKLLRDTANKLDAGNSEITDSEAMDIMSLFSHEVMSKTKACEYLNISRSRFDDLVREKKLPKGRKRVGFKELAFYKDELDDAVRKIKDKK